MKHRTEQWLYLCLFHHYLHGGLLLYQQGKGGDYIVEITDIRVRKLNTEGKMKAVVSVTFDNAIVVHDIKIIDGQEKLFIAMPSRKTPDGEFKDIAHPINAQMRQYLEDAILEKYETALAEETAEPQIPEE